MTATGLQLDMIRPGDRVSLDDYLAWEAEQEGRHELDRGVIGHAKRPSVDHARFQARLLKAAAAALRGVAYDPLIGFPVHAGPSVRWPDMLVLDERDDRQATSTTSPLALFEIISFDTREIDLTVKPDEYGALPSLEVYAAFDPAKPWARPWRRDACETLWVCATLTSPDDDIPLPGDVAIKLSALY